MWPALAILLVLPWLPETPNSLIQVRGKQQLTIASLTAVNQHPLISVLHASLPQYCLLHCMHGQQQQRGLLEQGKDSLRRIRGPWYSREALAAEANTIWKAAGYPLAETSRVKRVSQQLRHWLSRISSSISGLHHIRFTAACCLYMLLAWCVLQVQWVTRQLQQLFSRDQQPVLMLVALLTVFAWLQGEVATTGSCRAGKHSAQWCNCAAMGFWSDK